MKTTVGNFYTERKAFLAYFPPKHLQHSCSCSLGINAVVYGPFLFFSCIACQPLHPEEYIVNRLLACVCSVMPDSL